MLASRRGFFGVVGFGSLLIVGSVSGCEQRFEESGLAMSHDTGDTSDTGDSSDSGDSADSGDTGDSTTTTVVVEAGGCKTAADCDDATDCTQDLCLGGQCNNNPVNALCADGRACIQSLCVSGVGCVMDGEALDGTACDDDNACTSTSICATGVCIGIDDRDCDDGIACTVDKCDATSGCFADVDTLDGLSCVDGSDYSTGDVCVKGVCRGWYGDHPCLTVSDCDDGNPCTALTCKDSECVTIGVVCDDGLACTLDVCDPAEGCKHTPKNSLCEDGQWCEPGFLDIGGSGCVGCWESNSECDDENTCTDDLCVDHQCLHTPFSSDFACDDEDACTLQSFCYGGKCIGGDAKNCDDGKKCTDDWCNPKYGCGHQEYGCSGTNPPPSDPPPPPPVKTEKCNELDDDGDGLTDEAGAEGCKPYYWDGDGDGFGKAGSTCFCPNHVPPKYVPVDSDCNDADPTKTSNCGGGNPPPPPVDPAKFCSVRLANPKYELQGWSSALPADECIDPSVGAQWCVDAVELKVYSGGTIIANAKCDPGESCNQAGSVWAVGYTGQSCKQSELVTLAGVFQFGGDCVCSAKCISGTMVVGDNAFGDPNLLCTVAP